MAHRDSPGPISSFVEAYTRVRQAEGFSSADPAFVEHLPFRDLTGRNRPLWRVRAIHYLVVRAALAVLPGIERVLDLGAGNGWMARRLAGRYRVTAIDVDAGPGGLRALRDARVARVRGDLGTLPFHDGKFDAVVTASALHYAPDLDRALSEIARVLRPGGALVVADSPFYANPAARDRAWQRSFEYFSRLGASALACRYQGLTFQELSRPGLFEFVVLTRGIISWRRVLGWILRREAAAQMPVLLGRKR